MGEVDRGDLDLLAADVVPDVELGPVGQREDPHVLAAVDLAVVERPQLGALVLRVPLAELVAVGVDALLGAGLLLVAAAATEGGGEALLLDDVQQGADLEPVAARSCRRRRPRRWRWPPRREATTRRTPSRLTQLSRVVEHLGEVVAGVDLEHRERDLGGVERLLRQPEHDDGVLAAGEHQHRLLELGRDLAEDVDRLRLQLVELAQAVVRMGRGHRWGWTSRREQPSSYRVGRESRPPRRRAGRDDRSLSGVRRRGPLDSRGCGSLSSDVATSAPSTPPAWPSSATRSSASTSIEAQVAALAAGEAPFYEPGLPELLARGARRPGGCGSPPTPPRPPAPTCTSSASAPRSSRARTPPTCATSTPRSTTCCRT